MRNSYEFESNFRIKDGSLYILVPKHVRKRMEFEWKTALTNEPVRVEVEL